MRLQDLKNIIERLETLRDNCCLCDSTGDDKYYKWLQQIIQDLKGWL